MTRVLSVALGVVVLAATPSGAGWAVSGTKGTTAAAKTLAAVAQPGATSACVGDGKLGITVSWSHNEEARTGYELWRVVDGITSKVADATATTTSATDVVNVGVSLSYYVVTRSSTWRARSTSRSVNTALSCTA